MFRPSSLIVAVALVLSVAEGQSVNGFASKLFNQWNLERPLTSFVETTNMFTMDYGLSEEVELANIRTEIFTEECKYIQGSLMVLYRNPSIHKVHWYLKSNPRFFQRMTRSSIVTATPIKP